MELVIDKHQYLELEKIGMGAFDPLQGFMDETTFHSVVDTMRLPNGQVFPLPVVFDVTAEDAREMQCTDIVTLVFEGIHVGTIAPNSFYTCDRGDIAQKVFGTSEDAHPGVAALMRQREVFVGGPVEWTSQVETNISNMEISPAEAKRMFKERGWKTICGFQTRNVPHRAHEYLQRVALEHVDGLFVQPLVGRKRKGDFTPEAVMSSYKAMIEGFFPTKQAVLGILSTHMRYAGPREAVFHAIIRRNYGCTHFIIGRDHAGVGNYYGKYEAHALVRKFEDELGIKVLRLHGPFWCGKCDTIATEQTCRHYLEEPDVIHEISGTDMRALLSGGEKPQPHIMRPEIVASIAGVQLFIQEDEE